MANLIGCDHPRRHQVINLIDINFLRVEFLPDRVDTFDAAFDPNERHVGLAHLLLNHSRHVIEKCFVRGAAFL